MFDSIRIVDQQHTYVRRPNCSRHVFWTCAHHDYYNAFIVILLLLLLLPVMPPRRPSQIKVQNHTAKKREKRENNQALKRIQNHRNRKLNDARGTRVKIKVNTKIVIAWIVLKLVRT